MDPDSASAVGADALAMDVSAFVRAFGLHQPDQTPCGQPMSTSEAHALMELAASTGLSQKLLAERLRLEKSSVSRLVVRMGEKGWVRRDPDPLDRRSTLVRLTARGRRAAEQLEKARAEKFRVLYEALSEEERAAVSGALGTLVRAIEGRHAGTATMNASKIARTDGPGAPATARKENKR